MESHFYILELLTRVHGEKDKTRALLNYFHKKQPPKYPSKALMLKGRRGMVRRAQVSIGKLAMKNLEEGSNREEARNGAAKSLADFYKMIDHTGNKL